MARAPYSRFASRPDEPRSQLGISESDITRLNERTNSLSDDIVSLGAAVTTKFAEINSNFSNRINELGASIQSNNSDVRQQISALAQKFEERGRAPWTLLISFGSFLLVFLGIVGGLAYAPIQQTETRLADTVSRLADSTVGAKEFATFQSNNDATRLLLYNNTKERIDRTADALTILRSTQVPRSEHENQWKAQADHDAQLQRQLDQIRETVSGIYNPRDALARLERKSEEQDALILQLLKKAQ